MHDIKNGWTIKNAKEFIKPERLFNQDGHIKLLGLAIMHLSYKNPLHRDVVALIHYYEPFVGKEFMDDLKVALREGLKDGKIADYTRIDACLKTITYLVNNKAKTILMSHLGRPDGEKDPELSLKPVADSLSDKLSVKVKIAPDCIGQEVEEMVNNMKEENIILLENLRFHSGEEANDPEFVNRLARLADVYINDAFATAHRAHASTYGVPLKLFKENKDIAAGFLMDEELRTWKPILGAKGTGVAIIGGAKLKEKMKAVKELSKSFDRIIIGGVVANVFMKAAGYDISDSKYMEEDKDYTDDAKAILKKCKNIILPSEVVIATTDFKEKGKADPKQGLEKGTIAADTKYYSFGTKMYVPGYGWGVIEDRGGAMKGPDRLDLFYRSHNRANKWGRQHVTVKIKEK